MLTCSSSLKIPLTGTSSSSAAAPPALGIAVDAAVARLPVAAARAARLRQGHVEPEHQAGPRRRALPRAGQHRAGDGGAEGARHPAAERPAPGQQPRRSWCPNYDWWESAVLRARPEALQRAGRQVRLRRVPILSREETLARLPTIGTDGLRGGVVYYDGQFDDCAAADQPGSRPPPNRARRCSTTSGDRADKAQRRLRRRRGRAGSGDRVEQSTSRARGRSTRAARSPTRCGGWPIPTSTPLIAPSQGIHLVFDRSFLPGDERDHGAAHRTAG